MFLAARPVPKNLSPRNPRARRGESVPAHRRAHDEARPASLVVQALYSEHYRDVTAQAAFVLRLANGRRVNTNAACA